MPRRANKSTGSRAADARPCAGAWPPVRPMHGRAWVYSHLCACARGRRASLHGHAVSGPRAVSHFLRLLMQFLLHFLGGPLSDFFRAYFREKIRVSIASNKPH